MTWRILGALILSTAALHAADRSLRLPIGDPARKDKEARLVLDAITDTATGELITPKELAARIPRYGIVFLGESHTSMEFHNVQLRVIQELVRAGRKVMVGLEMYPYTEQKYLDDWTRGRYTESGFIELSQWYKNWGYHWEYYRDIFLLARDHGLPMFGVNTPREVVTAVRKKGFQNLTPEEAAHIPASIDTSNADHFTLFKAFFAGGDGMHSSMDDSALKGMFDAQCTWDATMGYNSVRALKDHGDSETVMVVLIGSGHVAYGLGIQRQAARWFDGRMLSLIPIQVRDEKDEAIEKVQASYADFLWGLPQEKEPRFPELGLSTGDVSGQPFRKVINISAGSVAKAAGFQLGDVILSVDGVEAGSREAMNRLMAGKRWGDSAVYVVRRGENQVTLTADFRRKPPSAPAQR